MGIKLFRDKLLKQQAVQLEKYKPKIGEEILKADHVSFSYGNNEVISSITFSVNQGEKLAFVGKNGAGGNSFIYDMSFFTICNI